MSKKRIIFSAQPKPFIDFARDLTKKDPEGYELFTPNAEFAKMCANGEVPVISMPDIVAEDTKAGSFRKSAAFISDLGHLDLDYDAVHPVISSWLSNNLHGSIYQRVLETTMLLMTLSQVDPHLIVVHNDVEPVNRAMALWARAHNVPCLHVPHAIYLPHNDRSDSLVGDIHDIIAASHIAVAGPYQGDWYVRRAEAQGIKAELRMTGLPQFDRFVGGARDREKACYMFGLSPHRPVVTYFSSWSQGTNILGLHDGVAESYGQFLLAAKQIPEAQFIIKTHPRSNSHQWHADRAQENGNSVLVTPIHLDLVLHATNVSVSYGPSNVILEAACVPDMHLVSLGGFLSEQDIVSVVPKEPDGDITAEQIVEALRFVMAQKPPSHARTIANYLGPMDGHAYTRVLNWIIELAEGNS